MKAQDRLMLIAGFFWLDRYFANDDSGLLRILSEQEWRGIGITQSLGWEHFEVHAPEPHICEDQLCASVIVCLG